MPDSKGIESRDREREREARHNTALFFVSGRKHANKNPRFSQEPTYVSVDRLASPFARLCTDSNGELHCDCKATKTEVTALSPNEVVRLKHGKIFGYGPTVLAEKFEPVKFLSQSGSVTAPWLARSQIIEWQRRLLSRRASDDHAPPPI
jgi:hypothetical protein